MNDFVTNYQAAGRYFRDCTIDEMDLELRRALISIREGHIGGGVSKAIVGVFAEMILQKRYIPDSWLEDLSAAFEECGPPPMAVRQWVADLAATYQQPAGTRH